MSYHVVYAIADRPDAPRDGDQLATGTGWGRWGGYVLDRADDYPECAHLAQEGWVDGGPDFADLVHEAEDLTHARDPDVAAVSARLLAAVKARPDGTEGLVVTDGTPPGDDEG